MSDNISPDVYKQSQEKKEAALVFLNEFNERNAQYLQNYQALCDNVFFNIKKRLHYSKHRFLIMLDFFKDFKLTAQRNNKFSQKLQDLHKSEKKNGVEPEENEKQIVEGVGLFEQEMEEFIEGFNKLQNETNSKIVEELLKQAVKKLEIDVKIQVEKLNKQIYKLDKKASAVGKKLGEFTKSFNNSIKDSGDNNRNSSNPENILISYINKLKLLVISLEGYGKDVLNCRENAFELHYTRNQAIKNSLNEFARLVSGFSATDSLTRFKRTIDKFNSTDLEDNKEEHFQLKLLVTEKEVAEKLLGEQSVDNESINDQINNIRREQFDPIFNVFSKKFFYFTDLEKDGKQHILLLTFDFYVNVYSFNSDNCLERIFNWPIENIRFIGVGDDKHIVCHYKSKGVLWSSKKKLSMYMDKEKIEELLLVYDYAISTIKGVKVEEIPELQEDEDLGNEADKLDPEKVKQNELDYNKSLIKSNVENNDIKINESDIFKPTLESKIFDVGNVRRESKPIETIVEEPDIVINGKALEDGEEEQSNIKNLGLVDKYDYEEEARLKISEYRKVGEKDEEEQSNIKNLGLVDEYDYEEAARLKISEYRKVEEKDVDKNLIGSQIDAMLKEGSKKDNKIGSQINDMLKEGSKKNNKIGSQIDAMLKEGSKKDNKIDSQINTLPKENKIGSQIDTMLNQKKKIYDKIGTQLFAMLNQKKKEENKIGSLIEAMLGKKERNDKKIGSQIHALLNHKEEPKKDENMTLGAGIKQMLDEDKQEAEAEKNQAESNKLKKGVLGVMAMNRLKEGAEDNDETKETENEEKPNGFKKGVLGVIAMNRLKEGAEDNDDDAEKEEEAIQGINNAAEEEINVEDMKEAMVEGYKDLSEEETDKQEIKEENASDLNDLIGTKIEQMKEDNIKELKESTKEEEAKEEAKEVDNSIGAQINNMLVEEGQKEDNDTSKNDKPIISLTDNSNSNVGKQIQDMLIEEKKEDSNNKDTPSKPNTDQEPQTKQIGTMIQDMLEEEVKIAEEQDKLKSAQEKENKQ